MNDAEILRKAESNEGLTVDEIKRYQQLVKPQKHVMGNTERSSASILKTRALIG